ncbi:MAG: hypothetical protein M0R33_16090 [Methylomonas sp.]|nr:hypothetical protein [Methylomonas sp.]
MTNNDASLKSESKEIKVLGIDLAKQSVHLYGVNEAGHKIVSRKLSRNQLTSFIAKLAPTPKMLRSAGTLRRMVRG